MLTKIRIQNFKQFDDVEIELGPVTVLIGPNNSGKTTILQALMLWYTYFTNMEITQVITIGNETINRYDLNASPLPNVNLLWRNLKTQNGKPNYISIEVHSDSDSSIGLDFSFVNSESIACAGIRLLDNAVLSSSGLSFRMLFLTPMSGLVPIENVIQPGAIDRLVGEGRTAEVLRNICFNVYEKGQNWQKIVNYMQRLFSVEILPPQYIAGRGELRMSYKDQNGTTFDISAAGRGMLQMLLLLAYMYDNPGSVLLLDEPDAHLEILRQREVYRLLVEVAKELNSQIILATHSEVIMDEAGANDVLIACVGKPHRIDSNDTSRKAQVVKALSELGHDQYFLALQRQWVLYLEGATDLAILQTFARALNHPASQALERPFTKYIGNVAQHARDHFYALREALESFQGIAILDRPYTADSSKKTPQKQKKPHGGPLHLLYWERNEIENYLCQRETLLAYAISGASAEHHEVRIEAMNKAIQDVSTALSVLGKPSPWSNEIKASNDFLVPVFKNFFDSLGQYNVMDKASFYILAPYVPAELIDPEVIEKLDAIWDIARDAPNT